MARAWSGRGLGLSFLPLTEGQVGAPPTPTRIMAARLLCSNPSSPSLAVFSTSVDDYGYGLAMPPVLVRMKEALRTTGLGTQPGLRAGSKSGAGGPTSGWPRWTSWPTGTACSWLWRSETMATLGNQGYSSRQMSADAIVAWVRGGRLQEAGLAEVHKLTVSSAPAAATTWSSQTSCPPVDARDTRS